MRAIRQTQSKGLYIAIALSLGTVAVADYFTALGIAVWIFYLLPLVLTLFLWRPQVPYMVAAIATTLLGLSLLTDEPGISKNVAMLNRAFGLLTIWVTAIIGNQFIRIRLTVRKDQWLQTAQNELSVCMSGDQNLQQLGDSILKFLAEYTEAKAGAIFIQDDSAFKRFGSYALPADAKLPDKFAFGEGLLGQAAKDAKTFIVHDVPTGYLAVGSGLGQTPPRHLLIAAASIDHNVNTVIELGYFEWPDDANVELLTRLSESIAVAVRSAKFRTRLQELLEETQRQAEELQAQSEELRVSNEELEEQGRALKESQARLEQQQAELEQTNAHLEEQTQLLEKQKDDLGVAKDELEKRSHEVEQASRYKSEFLANMSHELRTPLNSSLILAKLLADNKSANLTAEQVKFAQTIHSAGNDLLALINDVLDLSKIESGKMEINLEQVSISRMLENLRNTFQPLAGQKGLTFRVNASADVPEEVETDSQRFEQVLKNLLANAIKFTERGEVTLELTREGGNQISFAVRDTGIGIPKHQQQIIFEPFCQADGTTNRKYGGTGLGLSISREIVSLLGGRITVKSEPGSGSTFTVQLPVKFSSEPLKLAEESPTPASKPKASTESTAPAYHPPHHAPAAIPRRARTFEDDREKLSGDRRIILVVEDDESFARIVYDLARELGFHCLVAVAAEEAVALALQYNPSAVVLDVGLPDHSGLSVLDRLKNDNRTRHIPVHVVSAADYVQTAFSLGAVGYLLKPVKREQLVEAFDKLEIKLSQKLRRVLVVEDDAVQLDSVRKLLASADVETVGAQTASDCLERLKSETFDCMVLDLSLPDQSGLALLETLSKEDSYSFPPVIVYTGRELSSEEEQKLRRYSKSIIIKGAKSPERLLDEVTLFLHQVVEELPPEKQKMLQQARSRDAALEGKRIMIVEDDVRNIFALTSLLEPHGVKLLIARNGREAIETLEKVMPEKGVDLVLMDVMMPEMDGLTAMREIRKRPEWKKLPIISLTAKAMKNDQEQCLEAGANDYMAKPLDVDKLLSLVRVWMPR
ncbi:MAG TPA: response regulator [Verrucomicrobiae bacterium]